MQTMKDVLLNNLSKFSCKKDAKMYKLNGLIGRRKWEGDSKLWVKDSKDSGSGNRMLGGEGNLPRNIRERPENILRKQA